MPDETPELLSSRRVRQMAGDISRATLFRWRSDPKLKFPKPITIRGQHYFRRDKVEKWLREMAAREAA